MYFRWGYLDRTRQLHNTSARPARFLACCTLLAHMRLLHNTIQQRARAREPHSPRTRAQSSVHNIDAPFRKTNNRTNSNRLFVLMSFERSIYADRRIYATAKTHIDSLSHWHIQKDRRTTTNKRRRGGVEGLTQATR